MLRKEQALLPVSVRSSCPQGDSSVVRGTQTLAGISLMCKVRTLALGAPQSDGEIQGHVLKESPVWQACPRGPAQMEEERPCLGQPPARLSGEKNRTMGPAARSLEGSGGGSLSVRVRAGSRASLWEDKLLPEVPALL